MWVSCEQIPILGGFVKLISICFMSIVTVVVFLHFSPWKIKYLLFKMYLSKFPVGCYMHLVPFSHPFNN